MLFRIGLSSGVLVQSEASVKIIKKYLGKCFSSPRRLRGEKVPNVDPSHLICERQIKR
jgi:hypothetical protein